MQTHNHTVAFIKTKEGEQPGTCKRHRASVLIVEERCALYHARSSPSVLMTGGFTPSGRGGPQHFVASVLWTLRLQIWGAGWRRKSEAPGYGQHVTGQQ